jgi:hypothetical protein
MQDDFKNFNINGKSFSARDCVDGILINPKLPKNFDSTNNEYRPVSHQKYWNMPYIETLTIEDWEASHNNATDEYAEERRAKWATKGRQVWLEAWPSGVRYDVRCLDGGAWDRSTNWGMFATLEEALNCIISGPAWRNHAAALM